MRPKITVRKMPTRTSQKPNHSFVSRLSCHHWNRFFGFNTSRASEMVSKRFLQKGYSWVDRVADVRYIMFGSNPPFSTSLLSHSLQLDLTWGTSWLMVARVSWMKVGGNTFPGIDFHMRFSTETWWNRYIVEPRNVKWHMRSSVQSIRMPPILRKFSTLRWLGKYRPVNTVVGAVAGWTTCC